MLKYQCDATLWNQNIDTPEYTRCPNPAVVAFDHLGSCGLELVHFCACHQPKDWSVYEAVYVIKNDELLETGTSKYFSNPNVPHAEPTARDFAKDAIKRWEERKADETWLRKLGVRP